MRAAHVCLVALTLTVGCARFGYDSVSVPALDAAHRDASPDDDARVADAGSRPDARGKQDGGAVDASVMDASTVDGSGGGLDASQPNDGGPPEDDGGSMDAAVPDGGPIDLCPERSDALFCDGFEDPNFSRWSYPLKVNGTLEQSTLHPHSGTSSLRAATAAATGENSAARYGARIFDHQMTGDLWLRAFYYLPSSTVVTTNFSSIVVAEAEPDYFGFSLLVRPTGFDITQGNAWYRSSTVFPRDTWTCVEMHVMIDASAGVVEAYLDGTRVVRASGTDTLPPNGYTTVDVGIHYTEPQQGPVEVFVDDVVAGNTRIGCN